MDAGWGEIAMAEASVAGTYGEQFKQPFQEHILAVAARVPGFIQRYRSALDHTYFEAEATRVIARALFTHVDKFARVPTQTTLLEDIRLLADAEKFDAVSALVKKLYADDVSDSDAVMAKAVDFGKQQALINAVIESADMIDKGRKQDVLPRIQQAQLVGEDLLDIGIDYSGAALDVRSRWYVANRDQDTLPTGLPHLDYALGGGLGRGELGVILAPPKRGKSTTLVNFGYGSITALAGYNVTHYSLEMKDKKISMRYDDRLAGPLIAQKRANPQKYLQEIQARADKFVRGRLFIKSYPTRSATVSTFRSHLSSLFAQGIRVDTVLVDYGDIVKPQRRLGDLRHEQAGIYEDLRALAGEFDVAVWTASQGNRSSLEKPIVTMADFAESFEKAAVMDVGIAFCQTDDERIEGECRLFLMGVRDAEDGRTVACKIKRNQCLLQSVALYDSSLAKVQTPYDDDEDDNPDAAQTKARVASATQAVRVKSGLVPPQRKGAAPAPAAKLPARRKDDRLSKTVPS